MSFLGRTAALFVLIAIVWNSPMAGGPADPANRPDTGPEDLTPPARGAADGGVEPWAQLSAWPSEAIVPWNEDLVISFENGRGLWLFESGAWTSLTSSTPYALLIACDTLYAAFSSGGGLWSYRPLDGWENLTLSEPVRLVDAGTRLIADFGESGLWEYKCGGAQPVSLRLDDLETPGVTGEVQGNGTCSGDPSMPCTRDFDCASATPPAGICENVPCLRTIHDWSAMLESVPLNSLGGISPYGDIILERVSITYDPAPSGVSSQVVGLGGVTIPADSSATVTFAPIALQALEEIPVDESITIEATLVFEGRTPSDVPVETGPVTEGLFIEKCEGAN